MWCDGGGKVGVEVPCNMLAKGEVVSLLCLIMCCCSGQVAVVLLNDLGWSSARI